MCMKLCSNCLKRSWCKIPGDDHIDCKQWIEDKDVSKPSNHGYDINIPVSYEPLRSNSDK